MNDNFCRSKILTKTLSYTLIFTNNKNPSIYQRLAKMQNRFKINQDHYFSNKSKLIYVW